jgi:hypothetical protein
MLLCGCVQYGIMTRDRGRTPPACCAAFFGSRFVMRNVMYMRYIQVPVARGSAFAILVPASLTNRYKHPEHLITFGESESRIRVALQEGHADRSPQMVVKQPWRRACSTAAMSVSRRFMHFLDKDGVAQTNSCGTPCWLWRIGRRWRC